MLAKLFHPESVALVGASNDPGKIGNVILKNLISSGYRGSIFPVNPSQDEIMGLRCYPDIKSIGHNIDLCVIAIPARSSVTVVQDCVSMKVPFIVMIPGGFAESGEDGRALQARISSMIEGTGTRIIGPNTVGIYVPGSGLNTTLTPTDRVQFPPEGAIAFISQSGALGLLTMDTISEFGTGIHSFINVGNRSDLDELDILEFLASRNEVRGIAMYLESIPRGNDFLGIMRKVVQSKPLVVLKAGRTETAAKAAMLHTASMATDDRVMEGVFRQLGIVRAQNETELMDFTRTLSYSGNSHGNRVAVVTSAGGVGVVTTDLLSLPAHPDLKMAELSERTKNEIKKKIVAFGSVQNPIDITADGSVSQVNDILAILNGADEVDMIILYALPQTPKMTMDLVDVAVKWQRTGKPLLVGVLGFKEAKQMLLSLEQQHVPSFPSISRTVRSAEALAKYSYYVRRKKDAVV